MLDCVSGTKNCLKVVQKTYLLLEPLYLRPGLGTSGAGHGTVPAALMTLERRARWRDVVAARNGLEGSSGG